MPDFKVKLTQEMSFSDIHSIEELNQAVNAEVQQHLDKDWGLDYEWTPEDPEFDGFD